MLLCHPQKQWYVKKLSEKARISIGQASKLKERLLEYEYIKETIGPQSTRFFVINPIGLLESWGKSYSFRINRLSDFYSPDDINLIEDIIARYCKEKILRMHLP